MKIYIKYFIFILTFILFINTVPGQSIPESQRSKNAILKVLPELKKEFNKKTIVLGSPIYIRIFKEEKELEIWVKNKTSYKIFKKYPICTYGFGTLGPKLKQGDGQAPEGFYFVRPGQLNPVSSYHLAFNVGYPNKYDRIHKRTGGLIMVHGECVSIGCFAMTNKKIEQIYSIVDSAFKNGQSFFRVHIFPFRMTKENMKKHKESEWYLFWENLKEGYDFFNNNNNPPDVDVKNKRYVFN